MLPHPLTNFEIQRYYLNEPRFNWIYSRDNLPNKIHYATYVINLGEYADIDTHWIALYALKVVSATFLLVCFVCLKESTCETRKNAFYFTAKALFILEIIRF